MRLALFQDPKQGPGHSTEWTPCDSMTVNFLAKSDVPTNRPQLSAAVQLEEFKLRVELVRFALHNEGLEFPFSGSC